MTIRKTEKNRFFDKFSLNMDISLNITHKAITFLTCIPEISMQGSVSQNFVLGSNFHFMKCRKKYVENMLKIYQKLPVF